jgi:stage V sporulation protein D (sporulation-specific penicillin-binding protein)
VKDEKNKIWRRTISVMTFVLVVGFGLAITFLIRWQVVDGESLKSAAINQSLQSSKIDAMRGTIYDATGTKILAQSASVWTVVIEPNYISDSDKDIIAEGLSSILDIDKATIREKEDEDSYYEYVKRKIETSTKEEIEKFLDDNNIKQGVLMEQDYKRYYPCGNLASVVLGFTGTDNTGLSGVELQYDNELSGTTGRSVNVKDAAGNDAPFDNEQYVSAKDGYNLVLTIDATAQEIVEKYLDEGATKYGAKNGSTAILMNVKTGAIIALATSNDYDPNDPFSISNTDTLAEINKLSGDAKSTAETEALQKQWRNKAISDTYEPGSVFKMVTASMAIDSGSITTSTTFTCTGSYVPYEGEDAIDCWVYPSEHGTETLREGIMNSCNPFFIQVGQTIGANLFYKYFKAFGLNEITGVDLPGESNGIFYDEEGLGPVQLATESFGQGLTVTPIQMITAACAVANGGYLVRPHVVDRMLDSDGNIVYTADTSYKRQVISTETSKTITSILEENATTGGAKNGYVAGYRVCGKTGTSEKIAKYTEDTSKPMEYIASFCGYAPANDPQYALLVFYDEPDRSTASGGAMAAPVFAQIMKEVLPYLGVENQATAEAYADNETQVPSLIGCTMSEAEKILSDSGLTAVRYNSSDKDETKVVMQMPSAGKTIDKDGFVYLYSTDTVEQSKLVTVPDFYGKSLTECKYEASQLGIQIVETGVSTEGTLKATSQDIASGEKVKPGAVVTVVFVDYSGLETTHSTG